MLEVNKIYCMDAIEFMKKIDDKSIDMILCDLPYGITSAKWDTLIDLDKLWQEYKKVIKDDGIIILTGIQPFTTDLINSNREWFRYSLIWDKEVAVGFLLANKRPMPIHEDILIFYKKHPTYNPIKLDLKNIETIKRDKRKPRKSFSKLYNLPSIQKNFDIYKMPTSIIRIKKRTKSNQFKSGELSQHNVQKPISLFEYLIKTYSNEGDLVMDCVVGSGTTAVACQRTNRRFICNDNNPDYVKIANKRIAQEVLI